MVTVLVQCNGEAKEAKEQIISLLGQDFPLTAKKLYNLMKKHYMTGTTYHAVYKHLNELVRRSVVIKEGAEYRLSGEWINRLRAFANQIEVSYAHKSGTQLLVDTCNIENVRLLSFSSLKNFDSFLKRLKRTFVSDANGNRRNIICWQVNHCWWNILYMQEQYEMGEKLKKKNIESYFLIEGSTKLDKWVSELYKKMGINVKNGIRNPTKEVVGIYNDTLVYLIYPPEMLAKVDKIFKESNSINGKSMKDLVELMNKNMKLYVMMIKNPRIVESYKKNILSYFKAS